MQSEPPKIRKSPLIGQFLESQSKFPQRIVQKPLKTRLEILNSLQNENV